MDRFPISVMELNELQGKIEEQQKKINNSEMLGSAVARLEEELFQFKLEGQRLHEQLLETKMLLVNDGDHWETCSRQVQMLNRELEDAKSEAESKTRECVPLVDERECKARDLENAEEDIRKLRSWVKTEQTSRKIIRRRLEAIDAQSP